MGRLSARSNPTNLVELERSRINISVFEDKTGRHFTLDRMDLGELGMADDLRLICIARAGTTTRRYELGTASSWTKEAQSLEGLDKAATLRFRVLLHTASNPVLVATAENIRPLDESQSESLLPMEPADLGERLWNLDLREDGPVLQFNAAVFPSAAGVENFLPFVALVLPEAIRQVMQRISADPALLDDESDPWSVWGGWLNAMGLDRPPQDEDQKQDWCIAVSAALCSKHGFATQLKAELVREGAE
jgi:hypothetical protein